MAHCTLGGTAHFYGGQGNAEPFFILTRISHQQNVSKYYYYQYERVKDLRLSSFI